MKALLNDNNFTLIDTKYYHKSSISIDLPS